MAGFGIFGDVEHSSRCSECSPTGVDILRGEPPEDCPCLDGFQGACVHCRLETATEPEESPEPEQTCERCTGVATTRRQVIDASGLGLVFEDELLCGYHADETKAHEDDRSEPQPDGYEVKVHYIDT